MTYHRTFFLSRAGQWMPLVMQELLTLQGYLHLPTGLCRIHVAQSLVFCVVFCKSLFVLFLLAIVFSVLRVKISVYPFGISNAFLIGIYFVHTLYIMWYANKNHLASP
jgi:hypothetical protein